MKPASRLILSTSPPAQTRGKPPGLQALRCRRRLPCRGLRYRPVVKELDAETGLYYYGARYLDPKTSRWLSGDPAIGEYIPSAPVNDEAKKRNGSLPGMGGVFNHVNLHAYHYAGNNPVKYTDPDGEMPRDMISGTSVNFLDDGNGRSIYVPSPIYVQPSIGTANNFHGREPQAGNRGPIQAPAFISRLYFTLILLGMFSNSGNHTTGRNADTFYSSASLDMRLSEGQLNVNANAGLANPRGETTLASTDNGQFALGLEGNINSVFAEGYLGLKNGSLGGEIGGALVKPAGSINLTLWGTKFKFGGEVIIGGGAIGASLGLNNSLILAPGVGFGMRLDIIP